MKLYLQIFESRKFAFIVSFYVTLSHPSATTDNSSIRRANDTIVGQTHWPPGIISVIYWLNSSLIGCNWPTSDTPCTYPLFCLISFHERKPGKYPWQLRKKSSILPSWKIQWTKINSFSGNLDFFQACKQSYCETYVSANEFRYLGKPLATLEDTEIIFAQYCLSRSKWGTSWMKGKHSWYKEVSGFGNKYVCNPKTSCIVTREYNWSRKQTTAIENHWWGTNRPIVYCHN